MLVREINSEHVAERPNSLTNVGGTLYFIAGHASGDELWKSDGTDAGTVRVKYSQIGSPGSRPRNLTNVGGTLYFVADDEDLTDRDLWKSDGTEAGTVLVKDFPPDFGQLSPLSHECRGDAVLCRPVRTLEERWDGSGNGSCEGWNRFHSHERRGDALLQRR